MKIPKELLWVFLVLFWATLLGCENAQQNEQLDRIRASFFDPQHYLVAHDGLPIGSYSRTARMNDDDEYEFRTTLRIPSANGLILATDSVFQFQTRSPYQLSAATRTTYAESNDQPYLVEHIYPLSKDYMKNQLNQASNEEYGLREFFALELALMANPDSVEDELVAVPTPFHETAISAHWTVRDRSDQSITVSSSVGELATYSFEQELPRLSELVDDSGLSMKLISVDDFVALNLKPPHVVKDFRVPVDRPIESPRTVANLTVQFKFDDEELGPWSSLLDENGVLKISTEPNVSTSNVFEWSSEVSSAQTTHKLRSIVSEVLDGLDEPDQIVNAIVAFVNRTITYTDWNTLQSVEDTVVQKIGDCTEFAQLFTALATGAELQARTVVGLAYHESSQTFGIHAWNEVLFKDGSTREVDPTWNQIHADATHIEFPHAYQHEIVSTLKKLRIKVLSVGYDTDQST